MKASDLPRRVLIRVLARNFKSKRYNDLVPLDGGTVGIANFSRGGLASLYRLIDTERYFGRAREDMIRHYSADCRPAGKSGNDTGWGCYSKPWWKKGMAEFLASPETEETQEAAWLNLMKPAVDAAINQGWTDDRSLAIAMGIANSMGTGGFSRLAASNRWDAEQTLTAYVGQNQHRIRRRDAINETFPKH